MTIKNIIEKTTDAYGNFCFNALMGSSIFCAVSAVAVAVSKYALPKLGFSAICGLSLTTVSANSFAAMAFVHSATGFLGLGLGFVLIIRTALNRL